MPSALHPPIAEATRYARFTMKQSGCLAPMMGSYGASAVVLILEPWISGHYIQCGNMRARCHPRLNPCQCGFFGDTRRACRCSSIMVQKYRQRISGPLLDRIDLHLDVPLVDYQALKSTEPVESSVEIRARVEKARAIQTERFKGCKGVHTNSSMTPRLIKKHCELESEGSAMLEHAMGEMHFSARAHDRILKVARTLADLKSLDKIDADSVLEAVNYRTLDRNLWQ